MPLIEKKIFRSTCFLGIWEVTENENDLLKIYPADKNEISLLNSFTHSFRRIQFLASRLLLHTLLPNAKIKYDANGKPWLHQGNYFISLSHSGKFIALIISNFHCGIDIEIIRPKIEKIAPKFLCEKEMEESQGEFRTERLHIYWCVKEAMYKVHGKKNVSLRTDIFVEKVENIISGKINATLKNENSLEKLEVCYERFNDCILAWTESPR